MTKCLYCGDDRHPWWDCRKKPDGWKPDVARPKNTKGKSLAFTMIKDGLEEALAVAKGEAEPHAVRRRGRPKTGFDKAAYNRDYMRKRRAKARKPKE